MELDFPTMVLFYFLMNISFILKKKLLKIIWLAGKQMMFVLLRTIEVAIPGA